MNALQEKLFLELRQIKSEIEYSLKNKENEDWLENILNDELKDVDAALAKIQTGSYGHCEISGELIPHDLLELIPTVKTLNDIKKLETYRKKTIGLCI
jgi:RNA polymerase-binding transcription factor DksA